MTPGYTVTFTYDSLDRAAQRGGANFGYNDLSNNPILSPTAAGEAKLLRDPGGDPLSTKTGAGTGTLLLDNALHRDIVATADVTTGVPSASADYDPFGSATSTSGGSLPLGFQGGWTDFDTALINAHARWYDPATGAFTSRDTLTLEPDPVAQANRYLYANASPLTSLDPDGHRAAEEGLIGGGVRFDPTAPRTTIVAPTPAPPPLTGVKRCPPGNFACLEAANTAPASDPGAKYFVEEYSNGVKVTTVVKGDTATKCIQNYCFQPDDVDNFDLLVYILNYEIIPQNRARLNTLQGLATAIHAAYLKLPSYIDASRTRQGCSSGLFTRLGDLWTESASGTAAGSPELVLAQAALAEGAAVAGIISGIRAARMASGDGTNKPAAASTTESPPSTPPDPRTSPRPPEPPPAVKIPMPSRSPGVAALVQVRRCYLPTAQLEPSVRSDWATKSLRPSRPRE